MTTPIDFAAARARLVMPNDSDYVPEDVLVGAKQTSLGVYRLTKNGRVLGDSRGFSYDEVADKVCEEVEKMRSYSYPVNAVVDPEVNLWAGYGTRNENGWTP
jgi:hypothetical protein